MDYNTEELLRVEIEKLRKKEIALKIQDILTAYDTGEFEKPKLRYPSDFETTIDTLKIIQHNLLQIKSEEN